MNEEIILDIAIKERKIYRANFDKYSSPDGVAVFFDLINIRDNEGNLIAGRHSVSVSIAMELVGKLQPKQEVSFSAQVIADEGCPDGVNFIRISFT